MITDEKPPVQPSDIDPLTREDHKDLMLQRLTQEGLVAKSQQNDSSDLILTLEWLVFYCRYCGRWLALTPAELAQHAFRMTKASKRRGPYPKLSALEDMFTEQCELLAESGLVQKEGEKIRATSQAVILFHSVWPRFEAAST